MRLDADTTESLLPLETRLDRETPTGKKYLDFVLENPKSVMSILTLTGVWARQFFSLSPTSLQSLEKMETVLKTGNSLIRVIGVGKTLLTTMKKLTNAKEILINWLKENKDSTEPTVQKTLRIAKATLSNLGSASRAISSLQGLEVIKLSKTALKATGVVGDVAFLVDSTVSLCKTLEKIESEEYKKLSDFEQNVLFNQALSKASAMALASLSLFGKFYASSIVTGVSLVGYTVYVAFDVSLYMQKHDLTEAFAIKKLMGKA